MCELECASFAVANLQQQRRCLIKSSERQREWRKTYKNVKTIPLPFAGRESRNRSADLSQHTKHIFSLLFFSHRPLLFVFIFDRALYHTSSLTCYSTASNREWCAWLLFADGKESSIDGGKVLCMFFSSLLIITFNHVWKLNVRLKTTRR